jgi:hypothetical protein
MPGTYSDFILDDGYFHSGVFEGVTQNINLFNAASNGAIQLVDKRVGGHFNHTLGYKQIEDAWTRRDITAATAITSTDTKKIAEFDQIGVKVNVKMFIQQTLDSFQKNFDPDMKGDYEEISNKIGAATGFGRLKQQANQALASIRAALMNSAATANKYSSLVSSSNNNGKLNSTDLINGLATQGDAAGSIVCWVMHSKAWFDLMKQQVTAAVTGITDYVMYAASPITLNRPVLVTDSTALSATIGSGSTAYTEYYTLGLVEGAAQVMTTENDRMIAQVTTGGENLVLNLQGEGAHNLNVKGAKWDVGNGGTNPTDASLGTASNWDPSGVHYKNRAGFVINHR